MEYRRLGNTGLRISAISIGGWLTIGGSIEQDEQAHRILRTSIEQGINFIDLADIYSRGESERVTGQMLGDYRRSDLVISSKVYWPMSDNPNDRGLSRKHIMESVEGSLRRLQTDYLDLYFCHRFDEETPLEETVRAMDDLVRQGKILYWGTSMWTAEQLRRAHEIARELNAYAPVVEQPRYNLIHREIEAEVVPTCQELGMGLVVWSPLAQGLLTGKYNDGVPEGTRASESNWLKEDLTPQNLERVRAFTQLAHDSGFEPAPLALAWAMSQPGVSSVITGATRPEHVESNVKAASVELSEDLMQELEGLFPASSPEG